MKRYRLMFIFFMMAALAVPAFMSGCGSSGGGADESTATGEVNLRISDAPVDGASKVVVEFTGVTIQSADGERLEFNFDPEDTKKIDLLSLNGGKSEVLLDGVTVPAGEYSWIRLGTNAECDMSDSYIEFEEDDGSVMKYSMWIPSSSRNGLKLVSGFNVPAGGTADFTVDFDLRKSVNKPEGKGKCSGNYKLKPALRIVDNTMVGSISGTVDPALIEENGDCTGGNAVYVFEGGVIPDDEDGIEPDPVTSAVVVFDNDLQKYVYRAAFLSAGNYTAAFTCQAGDDDPEVDETLTGFPIAFTGTADLTVSAGVETIHDF